jgi:hypothetical protein
MEGVLIDGPGDAVDRALVPPHGLQVLSQLVVEPHATRVVRNA